MGCYVVEVKLHLHKLTGLNEICSYFHFFWSSHSNLEYSFMVSYSGQAHGRWETLQDLDIQRLQMGCGHIGTFLFFLPYQRNATRILFTFHPFPRLIVECSKVLTGSCLIFLAMILVMSALSPIRRSQMDQVHLLRSFRTRVKNYIIFR